jgi:hypothetical protein
MTELWILVRIRRWRELVQGARRTLEDEFMEVTAVAKARALVMIELDALTNRGRVRLSDCIRPLVERYDFQKFPVKPEDFDIEEKGVRFESGKANGLLIDSLIVYNGALVVDTLASTNESKAILLDLLEWGRTGLGISYEERLIRRWGNISHIIFKTDIPLLALYSSPLQKLAAKTSAVTEEIFEGLKYAPNQIWIGHDPAARKNAIASLFIAHRVNTSYSENEFFSEAPLPTHLHIQFLREFEQDVKDSIR